MYSKGCPVIVHVRSFEQEDECEMKVISRVGKYNHGRANRNSYFSESGVGRGKKRKYARDVYDEDSELENEDDEGEELMMEKIMMKRAMMEKRVMMKGPMMEKRVI